MVPTRGQRCEGMMHEDAFKGLGVIPARQLIAVANESKGKIQFMRFQEKIILGKTED